MTFRVAFVFSFVSAVICGHSEPQDTTLEDIIMPGVRSFSHSDRWAPSHELPDRINFGLVYPGDSINSRGPANDIDVVLPVFPTGNTEDEEAYVDLPDWMDVDLDKLSLDKVSLLNNANNLTELAALFGLTEEQQDKLEKESQMEFEEGLSEVGLRFGSVRDNEIVTNAEFAGCKPELKVVELEAPPSTLYLPQCVRLQRCGGCCTGKLLSCQPTKTEVVTLKVMKLDKNRRTSGSRRTRRGARARYTMVDQVNHLGCSCQCRTQEHHCDKSIHHYKASECACVCKNREEESKCVVKNSHYWDRTSCSCKCKRTQTCSTGEEFSKDSCSCVRISSNSVVFGGLDSRSPNSKSGIPCPQCALDRAPVCGSDGRTYINHCEMDVTNCENTHNRVTVLHLGSCDRKARNFVTNSELEFLPRAPSRKRNKPVRVPLQ